MPNCKEIYLSIDRGGSSRLSVKPFLREQSRISLLDLYTSAPQAPQNLVVVTAQDGTIELDWDDLVKVPDSYSVYIAQTSDGTIVQQITGLTVSSYTVTGLTDGVEYECWVTATTDSIESEESNHVLATPQATVTGTHLTFNGTDQYVNAGTLGTFGSSLMQLNTIECKFVNSNTAPQVLVGAYQDSIADNNTFGQRIRYALNIDTAGANTAGVLLVEVIVDNRSGGDPESIIAQVSGLPLNDGLLHHLAVVTDKALATVDVIFDGVVQTVTYSVQGNSTQFVDWHIDVTIGALNQLRDGTSGIGSLSSFFSGKLDEFRIWSDKRTLTEINDNKDIELVSNNYSVDFPNLFRYYKCNDGIGDILTEEVAADNATLVGNVGDNMWSVGNL